MKNNPNKPPDTDNDPPGATLALLINNKKDETNSGIPNYLSNMNPNSGVPHNAYNMNPNSGVPQDAEVKTEKPEALPQTDKHDPSGATLALLINNKVDFENDDNHDSPGAKKSKDDCKE